LQVYTTPADNGVAVGVIGNCQYFLAISPRAFCASLTKACHPSAPIKATFDDRSSLLINTDYPFDDRVELLLQTTTAKTTPLRVRIPAWATAATAVHNGNVLPTPSNGSMMLVQCAGGGSLCNVTIDLNPSVRIEDGWYGSAVAVLRGSLLLSAKLQQDFIDYKVDNATACSNQPYNQGVGSGPGQTNCGLGPGLLPSKAKWFGVNNTDGLFNWALVQAQDGSVSNAGSDGGITKRPLQCETPAAWPLCAISGSCKLHDRSCPKPFAYSTCPLEVSAAARLVPGWSMATELEASSPPESPACGASKEKCGPVQNITLVPHGCTAIRVGTFPLANVGLKTDDLGVLQRTYAAASYSSLLVLKI
jgi:hypothetical protein